MKYKALLTKLPIANKDLSKLRVSFQVSVVRKLDGRQKLNN
jgi:hypothetical protein